MDYSKEIYTQDEVLEKFDNTFRFLKINNRATVSKLISIKQRLRTERNKLKADLIEELDSKTADDEMFNRAVLSFIEGNITKEYLLIKEVTSIIEKYAKDTLYYMGNKKFRITLKEFSEMLDINERYISRNLLEYLDYFKMKTVARYVIKEKGTDLDVNYLNKEVFISRDSIKEFIKKYLKFSSKKVQIDLTMPPEKLTELRKKFKGEKSYRAAIMKVLKSLDAVDQKLKEEKRNNSKFTRLDLPLYPLKDEAVEDILNFETELKATETIIKDFKALERIEYVNNPDADYNYKSLSSKVIYDILDNNIATIRFVLDDLNSEEQVELDRESVLNNLIEELNSKNINLNEDTDQFTINKEDLLNLFDINKKLFVDIKDVLRGSKIQKRFIARYSANTKDLMNYRSVESEDNFLYAIDEDAYKEIIGDLKTDSERREAILNYFYNEMMKPEFKAYDRKKKDN